MLRDWQYRITKVLVTSLIAVITASSLSYAQRPDLCSPLNPCQNGAPCFTLSDSVFFCYCENTGHFGRLCENPIQTLQCPNGVPISPCTFDPCITDTCQRYPDAICGHNICGSCSSEFTLDGVVVACFDDCPPNRPQVECLVNPCDNAACPGRTDATCVPNYCGQCSADFYDSAGNAVDCFCPATEAGVVECPASPCDTAECPTNPRAECRSDSCGACSVAFFEGDREIPDCRQINCPLGESPVECFVDPCAVQNCTADPTATCVPNYCGGCTAQFYNSLSERVQCGDSCDSSPCSNNGVCRPIDNFFVCYCPSGFTGRTCEERAVSDPCDPSPCLNGGSCERAGQSFTCSCPLQYVGDNCERANLCFPSPCLNGGTCSLTPDLIPVCTCTSLYTGSTCAEGPDLCAAGVVVCQNGGTCRSEVFAYCECPPGYSGGYCEEEPEEPCLSGPCRNGGFCLNLEPAQRPSEYLCVCMMGYTGSNCGTRQNICDNLPCRNGGTCEEATTANGRPSFSCQCSAGFTGPTCEIVDDDPCSTVSCVNGFCFEVTTALGICICSQGFMGAACDMAINPCTNLPCQNGGSCLAEEGAARCECAAGYAGSSCQILVSPCAINRCFNEGTCRPDMSAQRGYVCECPELFGGDNCQTMITNPCFPDPCVNGFCVISNIDTTQDLCLCQAGFTGANCDLPLDPCLSSPCLNGAQCLTFGSGNGYFCNCTESFMGLHCEQRVLCSPNPCFNGGSCQQRGPTDFTCLCPAGYTGDRCQILLDPCLDNECVNGECIPFLTGYRCICQQGYTGTACDEQDGCLLACPDDITLPATFNQQFYQVTYDLPETLCGYRTSASTPPGSFFTTGQSFIEVAFLDTDGARVDQCTFSITIGEAPEVTACDSSPCENGGTCINLQGNMFICLCPDTFRGQFCENQISTDPCSSSPCLNDGFCFNVPGTPMGYLCGCPDAFIGARCEIPDDACAREPCRNGATCVRQSGDGYTCLCELGFSGRDCDIPLACFSGPCQNGGVCIEGGVEGFFCTCPEGLTGLRCEQVDRCATATCENGATCINRGDSFNCLCREGFSGSTCGFNDLECALECPEDIVRTVGPATTFAPVSWEYERAVCGIPVTFTYMPGSSFPLGSTVVTGIMQSRDILRQCTFTVSVIQSDPCDSSPCENNGRCLPIANIFVCQCTMGYMGDRCETPTTPEVSEACSSNPCQNGATCFGNEESYFCLCTSDFDGQQCATPVRTDPCGSEPCSNSGTCIDLDDDRFVCICQDGYGGPTCDEDVMVDVTPPRLDFCPSNIVQVVPLQFGGVEVFWNEPRATDDSGSTEVTSQSRESGSFFPFGNTTVVYVISDPSGNTNLCVFMVSVRVEMQAPTCTPECPADISVVTDSSMDFTRVYWSLSSMTCNYTVVSSHRSGNFFRVGEEVVDVRFMERRDTVHRCSFTVTVTQGFRNFCGLNPCQHLGTCQDLIDRYECICARGFAGRNCENVTAVDEVRPVVSFCPMDISTCTMIGATTAPATWRAPRAVDDSGTVILSDQSHSPGDGFEVGVTNVVYEFCDPSGNKATCQFRVTVESAEQCNIRCPENIEKFVEEGVSFINVTWDQPDRMCDYPVTSSPLPGSFFPQGTNFVTVMTVDSSGDVVDQCTFIVAIRLANQGNPCDDPSTCGTGECILDSSVVDGYRCECTRCFAGTYCERAIPIINPCNADLENLCQNGGTCSFADCDFTCTCPEGYTGTYCQIERVDLDTTPPILVGCPVDITRTVGEEEEGTEVTWEKVRYFDSSGTAFFVGSNFNSGDVFPLGLTTVTMIYSDASGNLEYCRFNVNIQQVNSACNPNVCPDDIMLLNRGSLEYMEVFWQQVPSVCGFSVVSDIPSGELFPVGVTPVVWRMYDASGTQRAGCTFNVVVIDDFTNPCNTNPCEPELQCEPNPNTPDKFDCVCAPGVFQCGTSGPDKQPPQVRKCRNQETTVEKGTSAVIFSWAEPSVTDNMGAVSNTSSRERPSEFKVGSTEVTYNFSDSSGNIATCSFYVTVTEVDTKPPTIHNCTTDLILRTVNPGERYRQVNYIVPTATDLSGIAKTTVMPTNHNSGDFFPVGKTHTVVWEFEDGAGNTAMCMILIRVEPGSGI